MFQSARLASEQVHFKRT